MRSKACGILHGDYPEYTVRTHFVRTVVCIACVYIYIYVCMYIYIYIYYITKMIHGPDSVKLKTLYLIVYLVVYV